MRILSYTMKAFWRKGSPDQFKASHVILEAWGRFPEAGPQRDQRAQCVVLVIVHGLLHVAKSPARFAFSESRSSDQAERPEVGRQWGETREAGTQSRPTPEP